MNKKTDQITGAPAALKWLSDQVAKSEKKLAALEQALNDALSDEIENPPDKDGTDFAHIARTAKRNYDDAFDAHLKLLKQLQSFDKSVATEKRDSSEAVTRDEGEKAFRMMAICMRTAAGNCFTQIVPMIRECASNEEAAAKCEQSFNESLIDSVKSSIKEELLPSWAINAVEGVL